MIRGFRRLGSGTEPAGRKPNGSRRGWTTASCPTTTAADTRCWSRRRGARVVLARAPTARAIDPRSRCRRARATSPCREGRAGAWRPARCSATVRRVRKLWWSPAGSYMMGSPTSDAEGFSDERPQHAVRIGAPFAVGVYEVTFAEWDACVRAGGCGGHSPNDGGLGRGRRPVWNVSWEDARAYVQWWSRETGQRYRLLTEAEWEYVARAGTTTGRYWGQGEAGQCRYANGGDASAPCPDGHEYTAPAGSFQPNAFGLYDGCVSRLRRSDGIGGSCPVRHPRSAGGDCILFLGKMVYRRAFLVGSWPPSRRRYACYSTLASPIRSQARAVVAAKVGWFLRHWGTRRGESDPSSQWEASRKAHGDRHLRP